MSKKQMIDSLIVLFSLALIVVLFSPILPWDKYNLYDYLKAQRLQSYNQKHEKHLITCNQCKGSGEYPTDINKLMMDASLALYFNHHLMVDKCEKCVKLPNGDGYEYCETVESKYQTLLKEYAAAGPKVDMAACEKCMGMGQFTSVKKDGSYLTQEEYNKTHEQNK
jgi:Fe2+ or Zn2+ uptake regulation protein